MCGGLADKQSLSHCSWLRRPALFFSRNNISVSLEFRSLNLQHGYTIVCDSDGYATRRYWSSIIASDTRFSTAFCYHCRKLINLHAEIDLYPLYAQSGHNNIAAAIEVSTTTTDRKRYYYTMVCIFYCLHILRARRKRTFSNVCVVITLGAIT